MPCTIVIRDVVGIDTNGDGDRDRLVVVGTVEECAALTVTVQTATVPAQILLPGEPAFGVNPATNERVFLGRFELTDTTDFKGRCGSRLFVRVHVQCTADPACSQTIFWDSPVRCEPDRPVDDCPIITVTAAYDTDCESDAVTGARHRDVTVTVTTVPFSPGPADIEFGYDNPATGNPVIGTVALEALAEGVLGQGSVVHPYPAPESGTAAHYPVEVRVGRCAAEPFDVTVEACPAPPEPPSPICPEVRLAGEQDVGCNPFGNRIVRVRIEMNPAHDGFVRIAYGDGGERTVHTGGDAIVQVDLSYAPNDLSQPVVRITPITDDGAEICTQELQLSRLPAPCPQVLPEEPDEEVPTPDEESDENTEVPPPIDRCLLSLILVLLLFLAAGVAIIIAFCMQNPATIWTAIGLAAAALLALFLWMLFCGQVRCDLVRWLIFVLAVLAFCAAVLALVFALVGTQIPAMLPCAIGAATTFAYYGTIGFFLTMVAIELGCYDGSSVFPWQSSRRVSAGRLAPVPRDIRNSHHKREPGNNCS